MKQDRTEWHRWFAWYPVRTPGGTTLWLEFVFRKWGDDERVRIDKQGEIHRVGGYRYKVMAAWP